MARIRSIKPGFFTSDDVAELSLRARLTWIGLWCYCDDEGRGKANLKLIRAAIWPLDSVSLDDVKDDLLELDRAGRIHLYQVDGQKLLAVTNWADHQHPNRPSPSRLPAPSAPQTPPRDPSLTTHARLSEPSLNAQSEVGQAPTIRAIEPSVSTHGALTSGGEGRGEEQEGSARAREEPPTPYCSAHPNGTDGPCGACGRARETRQTWDAEQAATQAHARTAAAELRRACPDCDENGFQLEPTSGLPTRRCDHRRTA